MCKLTHMQLLSQYAPLNNDRKCGWPCRIADANHWSLAKARALILADVALHLGFCTAPWRQYSPTHLVLVASRRHRSEVGWPQHYS